MDQNIAFKFVPFQSFVHPSFWYKLAECKLNIDRLNDSVKNIFGCYGNSNVKSYCISEVDYTAFNQAFEEKPCTFVSHGALYNKNTIEDFKATDKLSLIAAEGQKIWKSITSGEFLRDPSLLSRFLLISFADLKKHNYYYWFAFPTLSVSVASVIDDEFSKVSQHFTADELAQLNQIYFSISRNADKSFFILENRDGKFVYSRLSDKISLLDKNDNFADVDENALYLCFSDPSCFENAGWPSRMFIAAIVHLCPNLRGKKVKILSIRCKNSVSIENSLVFNAVLSTDDLDLTTAKWIGWEKNENDKMLPRLAKMAASMDPERLAKSSVNLNLTLMKWRLLPTIDLNIIASKKCLLMGAGTLGCSVARNLLAWGVTHITFVDYGKVSYSNPVRQSLFTYEDALNGGKDKAETAAKRVNEICPGLTCVGHNIHIPMPGHTIGDSMKQQTLESIASIEKLVQEHDVIFLLTDSRESRWLPTMLGAVKDKIVMNAALGFDSYLVMRHGSRKILSSCTSEDSSGIINGLKCIGGEQLGCYFCNDITAPGNSMKDRTLDQQCTVTRPGVSNIAGSLVVELLVSVLQHKLVELAPAYIQRSADKSEASIPEGILGIIPHSIRGMLSSYQQILPATERFPQCIACSEKVLLEYKTKGVDFLLEAFGSTKYLEDLTGITDLMNEQHEILEFDGSDFEMSD